MIPPKQIPVSLTTPSKPAATHGKVDYQEWDREMRIRRAIKIWGICWGLAVVSVLIPGAHFILVPSFLLGGPIAAYRTFQQTRAILGGTGTCPSCGKEFKIARCKVSWPLNDVCDQCHDAVQITLEYPES